MEFNDKLMKRIRDNIDKTETCRLSKYAINPKGYTKIGINKKPQINFHRLMLFWSDQSKTAEFNDKKNWYACHTCRHKHCVNPAHLYWGTPQNNSDDKVKDGTMPSGSTHWVSKLTETQVLEIRAKHSKRKHQNDREISKFTLAKEYSVSPSMISKIVCRKNWTHI